MGFCSMSSSAGLRHAQVSSDANASAVMDYRRANLQFVEIARVGFTTRGAAPRLLPRRPIALPPSPCQVAASFFTRVTICVGSTKRNAIKSQTSVVTM